MSGTWKKRDLGGAGLQTLNLALQHVLRRRVVAYTLWLLFPVGAHRLYLQDRAGSLVYVALTALTLILWIAVGPPLAWWPILPGAVFALYDLFWIDRRVVEINKRLRMELYLGQGAAPPPGYRGRYGDEDHLEAYIRLKESEKAGHQPDGSHAAEYGPQKRAPTFAEQERMLRELAKHRKRRTGDGEQD